MTTILAAQILTTESTDPTDPRSPNPSTSTATSTAASTAANDFMVDFSIVLIVGIEGTGLVLYAMIMLILTAARTSSLRTQFYTQSWILGFFDIGCYFGNVLLRVLRDNKEPINVVYYTMIYTKMVTNGHQLTMIWLNVCRFQILYRPTATSRETSRTTFRYRWRWCGVLHVLGFSLSAYRLVLIGLLGFPDYSYNYHGDLLMLFIRTGTVGILLFPCLFCAILNIGCFQQLSRNSRGLMSSSQKKRNLRMLIYAALIVITAFPITFYQGSKMYGTLANLPKFTADMTQYFDLCYFPFLFGNPVILLGMSEEVRREFLNLLLCRWKRTAQEMSSYRGEGVTVMHGGTTIVSTFGAARMSMASVAPLKG